MIQDVALVAGQVQSISVAGKYISCLEASAYFDVSLENGRSVQLEKGMGWQCYPHDPEKHFKRLILQSATNQTVTLSISMELVTDNRLNIAGGVDLSKASVFETVADVTLGAAATTLILAANTDRREAIICSLAANSSVFRIGDSNAGAARGIELAPGESITIDTTEAIYGYNPGAAQLVGVAWTED